VLLLADQGVQTEIAEAALRIGTEFIHLRSNFRHPAGVTLMLERR
jgi:hypothetical protein